MLVLTGKEKQHWEGYEGDLEHAVGQCIASDEHAACRTRYASPQPFSGASIFMSSKAKVHG